MATAKVLPEQLQIGHYVCLPIGWTNHPFMFSNFKIKTADELVVLKSLNLETIDVNPEKSDIKVPSLARKPVASAPKKDKNQAKEPEDDFNSQHRATHRRADRQYSNQIDAYREALAKFNSNPDEVYFQISQLVNQTVKSLHEAGGQPSLYLVMSDKNGDDIFSNAMNVTVLAVQISTLLGLDVKQTQLIGLAAMCLDIGLLKVPSQIRRSLSQLSSAEQNYYEAHVGYSIEMLKKAESFPPEIMPLIANHHERLDGSGYPKGLKKEELTHPCQLLQLVDHFVHLINPLPSQKPMTPQRAIALLYKAADVKFNKAMLEALVKVLGIYPPGSYVELSDGQKALVCATNPADKLKPHVKLFAGSKQISDQAFTNLESIGLSIKKTISLDDLPEASASKLSQLRFGYFFSA